VLAATGLAVTVVSTLAAAPAWAAPPETWSDTDNPGLAQSLLEIGGPVLVLIALITLLTYLPSMISSSRGDDALTFADKSDWFGGPRTGVDDKAAEAQGTGGASARW
jgi:hypothetical protein